MTITIIVVVAVVVVCAALLLVWQRRSRRSQAGRVADVKKGPFSERTDPAVNQFQGRITKARAALGGYLGLAFGHRDINESTWQALQDGLIRADVGVEATEAIIARVKGKAKAKHITESAELLELLKAELVEALDGFDRSLHQRTDPEQGPSVWLFVGVNGVGKTTTIGKLAMQQKQEAVLAAGDTFRAAAGEQLEAWAKRTNTAIVSGAAGADPSSVVFDAVEHAAARGAPLVLADTAGRLQTKKNLMDELRKVRRVAEKDRGKVTEVLLVIDATTGQNGLAQARQFSEAVGVTGIVLTKLDGSAKGGIVVAIHQELGLPVKFVGLGEGISDLVEFAPRDFVEALIDG